jgi:uncharacterized membrane protein
MNQHWPVASLDPIRRLRVMAAATPGTDLTELIIDAPPELVWQTVSNLQAEMPRLVRDFRSVTVSHYDEERLGLLGVLFSGLCDKFQAAAPSRALVA